MRKRKNKDSKNTPLRNYARFSGLAFEMLGIIVLGVFIGKKLDEHSKRDFPLWTIVFSLFSIFVALYQVIKNVLKDDTHS